MHILYTKQCVPQPGMLLQQPYIAKHWIYLPKLQPLLSLFMNGLTNDFAYIAWLIRIQGYKFSHQTRIIFEEFEKSWELWLVIIQVMESTKKE